MRFLLLLTFSLLTACGQHTQESKGTLAGGEEVRIGTATGEEAVIQAINADDDVRLQSLVPSKWGVDARLKHGRTALTEACSLNKFKVVRMLVSLGADRELKDAEEKAAVDYALVNPALRRILFPEEALKQELALVMAVRNNKFNDVKKLLTDGVDANFLIEDARVPAELEAAYVGETPLTLAVLLNAANTVRTLLAPSFTTDANKPNVRSERALSLARARSLTQIEKMLLQRGAVE
jgi:ankyrin repeat protein